MNAAFITLCTALPWALLLVSVDSSAWAPDLRAPRFAATPIATAHCEPPDPAPPTPTPSATAEIPLGVGPTPTPAPAPDVVVDPALEPMVSVAAANLQACWNAGNWQAVTRIVTPRFLETALGIGAAEERDRVTALAALDLESLRIASIGAVHIWSDGRGAVDVFYWRGHDRALQAVSARWFFTAARGTVRFDEEALLLPPPLGDRVTIGFAIADDAQPLQWTGSDDGHVPASPVTALHGANRGRQSHTFLLQDASGATLGLLTLPPWQQGDLVMRELLPGSYVLRDPAVVDSTLTLEVGTTAIGAAAQNGMNAWAGNGSLRRGKPGLA